MWPVSMLACTGLFGVTLLVVAGVAHELGPVPFLGVLAQEHIEYLDLLLAQVEPLADLVEVVLLDLTHAVFLEFMHIFVLLWQR